jgi:hypothetical protein
MSDDLMTERQGRKIIELLEAIVSKLDSIHDESLEMNSNVGSIATDVSSIEGSVGVESARRIGEALS